MSQRTGRRTYRRTWTCPTTSWPGAKAVIALLVASSAVVTWLPAHAWSPRLVSEDTGSVVTVHTSDWPSGGWALVFDDAMNGAIAQFRIAAAGGGANLCADGSGLLPAAFFEKVWGSARGPHWLSGAFGHTAGTSTLLEANEIRARVVEDVLSTEAGSGERPAAIRVTYTILHTGRMYIETRWQLNDQAVLRSGPYGDNSWRMVLANRDYITGAADERAHAVLARNDIAGLPALIFSAYPTFWQNDIERSIDNADTRAIFCGPGLFALTSDPVAGIDGVRFVGTSDPASPYVAGSDFRHAFMIDWSHPADRPVDLRVASEAGLQFAHPDPLSGEAGVGWIEQGTLTRNHDADGDHDGFAEGEGCYVAQAAGAGLVVVLPPCRTTASGDPLPLTNPLFRIQAMSTAQDSLPLMSSIDGGITWERLTPGVDYLATTRADEAMLGAGVRLLSVLRQFPIDASVDVRLAYGDLAGIGLVVANELRGPVVESHPGEIVISWSAAHPRIYTGYEVSRMDLAGAAWRRLTPKPVTTPESSRTGHGDTPGAGFRWIDRTAVPGHRYRYRVEALPISGRDPVIITAAEAVLASAGGGEAGASSDPSGGPSRDAAGNLMTLRASPNPFNPTVNFEIEIAGDAPRLDIVDAAGRLVRVIWSDDAPPAPVRRTASWNGIDDRGRSVPSGIYFARLSTGRRVVMRKIVLLE